LTLLDKVKRLYLIQVKRFYFNGVTMAPWKFYGRQEQLATLESILNRKRWFFAKVSGRRRIGKTTLIQRAMEAVASTIRVRPGRSYPRRWDTRHRPKGHCQFATPARIPSHTLQTETPI
jgi:hypothetical protein